MRPRRAARRLAGSLGVLLLAGCAQPAVPPPDDEPLDLRAVRAGERFLSDYVDDDGRVVRRDQGGDTVSEGQAYAMVVASALGDDATFDRVWSWTRTHLMQPIGLPAWHIDPDGRIDDVQSASDADVLMAWALLRANGPDRAEHRASGLALADAVLRHEVVRTASGDPVLAAGPWAVNQRVINVSYWSSAVFDDLARATGEPTWSALADRVPALIDGLTRNAALLPSDWAGLDRNRLQPTASPQNVGSSPSAQPQYGLDAQRAVIWSAVACRPEERDDAARWHGALASRDRSTASRLTLTGDVVDPSPHPVPLVAASAAADAADLPSDSDAYLDAAEDVQREHPTFFGAAWIALGRLLLDTEALDACA